MWGLSNFFSRGSTSDPKGEGCDSSSTSSFSRGSASAPNGETNDSSSSSSSDRPTRHSNRKTKRTNNSLTGSSNKRSQRESSEPARFKSTPVKSSSSVSFAQGRTPQLQDDSLKVPMIGTWYLEKAYLTPDRDSNAKKNLMNTIFRGRALTLPVPKKYYKLNTKNPHKADLNLDFDGKHYSLVSFKSHEKAEGFGFWGKKTEFEWIYIALSGGGFPKLNLQDELEKLADFPSLDPRKVVVRLGHLQSPASHIWENLDFSQFEMIDEEGHVGCGYIPEDMLEQLLRTFKSKSIAENALGLQVRIVGPKLGILKGMLFRKRGITKIQLPSSMLKVPPTKSTENVMGFDNQDWVYMLATQQGIFPSRTSRVLDSRLTKALTNEDKPVKDGKPFQSDMVIRLWKGLGVTEDVVEKYVLDMKRFDIPRHSYSVGVADPTGCIPEGKIFVTGLKLKDSQQINRIFITRSPCVNPEDGRMLPLLTKKPNEMPYSAWRWLNKLPFGAVIFPLCKKVGEKSLPETIAAGDLDGDLYLLCWDQAILSCIQDNFNVDDDSILDDVRTSDDVSVISITDSDDDDELERNKSTARKMVIVKDEFVKREDLGYNDVDRDDPYNSDVIDLCSSSSDDQSLTDDDDDEEEEVNKWEIDRILSHRKKRNGTYEVEVLWETNERTWEPLQTIKMDAPRVVIDYSRTRNIRGLACFQMSDEEEEDKWDVNCILSHRMTRNGNYEVEVLWDSNEKTWEHLKTLKEDAPQAVIDYSREKKLGDIAAFQVSGNLFDEQEEEDWDDLRCEDPGKDWFSLAQSVMLNLPLLHDLKRLISCLYKQATAAAEKSSKGIHDDDAIAFGEAYKKALELEKHGGLVYLPAHLHTLVKPRSLHKFLSSKIKKD